MRELDFDWMRRILVGLHCRLDPFALQVSVFHIRVCLEDGQLVYSEVFLIVNNSVTAELKRKADLRQVSGIKYLNQMSTYHLACGDSEIT